MITTGEEGGAEAKSQLLKNLIDFCNKKYNFLLVLTVFFLAGSVDMRKRGYGSLDQSS